MSSGRAIPPASKNTTNYEFTGLATNTRHSIEFNYAAGVTTSTVFAGYTYTLSSLCKFPKYIATVIL